jgi:hypothetical protein
MPPRADGGKTVNRSPEGIEDPGDADIRNPMHEVMICEKEKE